MSDSVVLIATLKAKQGQEAALRAQLTGMVPSVLQEPGCVTYTLHEASDAPGTFMFYEVWANQAALDAHNQAPALLSLVEKQDLLLAEPARLQFFKLI